MWLRWSVRRAFEAGFILAFGIALLLPVAVAYDHTRFASIREPIDEALAQATPSERSPTEAVKQAFRLSGAQAYRQAANGEFRRRLFAAYPRNYPSPLEKLEVALAWAPFLRVHYSADEMMTLIVTRYGLVRGAKVGTGSLSVSALGKDLNDLAPSELECLARFLRVGRSAKDCTVVERKLNSALGLAGRRGSGA